MKHRIQERGDKYAYCLRKVYSFCYTEDPLYRPSLCCTPSSASLTSSFPSIVCRTSLLPKPHAGRADSSPQMIQIKNCGLEFRAVVRPEWRTGRGGDDCRSFLDESLKCTLGDRIRFKMDNGMIAASILDYEIEGGNNPESSSR